MREYEFKKEEVADDCIYTELDRYTCNVINWEHCRVSGKYYKKEDVITLLGEFINAFSPVKKSIQEMIEIFESLIKV